MSTNDSSYPWHPLYPFPNSWPLAIAACLVYNSCAWEVNLLALQIVPIAESNLNDIPPPCRACLYWEWPGDFEAGLEPTVAAQRKREWFARARQVFGISGLLAYLDGVPVAYAQYAPPTLLPNIAEYAAGPVDNDAIFISCLYVAEESARGQGIGTALLQRIIADVRGRGYAGLETFGRIGSANNCSGPVELYLKNGFRVVSEGLEFPLLRLDLAPGEK
jgi:GNAT superfamily N-acetyltransferase